MVHRALHVPSQQQQQQQLQRGPRIESNRGANTRCLNGHAISVKSIEVTHGTGSFGIYRLEFWQLHAYLPILQLSLTTVPATIEQTQALK
jgi:hypothetical protein